MLLMTAVTSRADLKLSLKIDPSSAIQFETVNAYVSVYNDNDSLFILDVNDSNNVARAFFMVEKKPDGKVKVMDDRPPVRWIKIMPGEKHDFISDISLLYDLGQKGRYVIKAAIEVGKIRYESNPVIIDVVRGIEIASATRPVPGYPDVDRRYTLRYWTRDKREFLFLCIDEDEGKTSLGVFQLGTLLRVSKPALNLDRAGNVQVIHQTNRDCFIMSRFESNLDGVFFVDQSYHGADGKPYPMVREAPAPSK